jgi:hypothetical protein
LRSELRVAEGEVAAEAPDQDELDPEHGERLQVASHRQRTGVDRLEAEIAGERERRRLGGGVVAATGSAAGPPA